MGHLDFYVGNTMLTVGQDYFLHSSSPASSRAR
jgi:hypothetical protein